MNKMRDEKGQGSVEGALGAMTLAAAFLGAFYLIFALFGLNAAASAIQAASWNVDAETLAASADKDRVIQDAITSSVPASTAQNVKVTGTTAEDDTRRLTHSTVKDGMRLAETNRYLKVRFKVSYTAPMAPWAKFEKEVEHTMLVSTKTEVLR